MCACDCSVSSVMVMCCGMTSKCESRHASRGSHNQLLVANVALFQAGTEAAQCLQHDARLRCDSFTVTNKSDSLTYTVASSFVCTSPVAVTTVVGLFKTLTVANSAEFVFPAQHVH